MRLEITKKAIKLTKLVYSYCNDYLPEKEKFGLWSQMTRCAVSIPSNIVEGEQRSSKEFIRFLYICRGSIKELEIQFEIAESLYGCDLVLKKEIECLSVEVSKMSWSLISHHSKLTKK